MNLFNSYSFVFNLSYHLAPYSIWHLFILSWFIFNCKNEFGRRYWTVRISKTDAMELFTDYSSCFERMPWGTCTYYRATLMHSILWSILRSILLLSLYIVLSRSLHPFKISWCISFLIHVFNHCHNVWTHFSSYLYFLVIMRPGHKAQILAAEEGLHSSISALLQLTGERIKGKEGRKERRIEEKK